MHEYTVTKNIVDIAVKEATKSNAKKIICINLVIGELSTIIDESVQMYFDFFTEDTIANGAKLNFRKVKAEFECNKCFKKFNMDTFTYECPQCGGLSKPTDIGREFYIESIDIE